jgi:hypothetical protein
MSCTKRGWATKAEIRRWLRRQYGMGNSRAGVFRCPDPTCRRWHVQLKPPHRGESERSEYGSDS